VPTQKLLISVWKKSDEVPIKVGFLRTSGSDASLQAFVRDTVLVQFATQISNLFKADDYFTDLRDSALSDLNFTVMFDGAPYTLAQVEEESLAVFLSECTESSAVTRVPNLIL